MRLPPPLPPLREIRETCSPARGYPGRGHPVCDGQREPGFPCADGSRGRPWRAGRALACDGALVHCAATLFPPHRFRLGVTYEGRSPASADHVSVVLVTSRSRSRVMLGIGRDRRAFAIRLDDDGNETVRLGSYSLAPTVRASRPWGACQRSDTRCTCIVPPDGFDFFRNCGRLA